VVLFLNVTPYARFLLWRRARGCAFFFPGMKIWPLMKGAYSTSARTEVPFSFHELLSGPRIKVASSLLIEVSEAFRFRSSGESLVVFRIISPASPFFFGHPRRCNASYHVSTTGVQVTVFSASLALHRQAAKPDIHPPLMYFFSCGQRCQAGSRLNAIPSAPF